MKSRIAAVACALLTTSVISTGVAAAHPTGSPGVEQKQEDFAAVVARSAGSDSERRRGYSPCIRGMAADTFPCDNVDMWSHLPIDELGLSFVNDIWGWTDPRTRESYAIIGGTEGTVFVSLRNPVRPEVKGILPTHSTEGGTFWRDIKVHADHAYIVSEHTEHGMQVFDLTQLRDIRRGPVTLEETAHYDEFGSAHNININTDTGFAYAVGTQTCAGGLHMVDLSDPTDPVNAGCFEEHGYIHDTQCVIYEGPDADFLGHEICFNSNADASAGFENIVNALSIVDVTDKDDPVALSRVQYEEDGYSHQGWLTPDQSFFLHGDELDELLNGNNTRTRTWDVRDLTDPRLIGVFDNDTTSIDHNIYTKGDLAFASNYTSGLRVYDTSEVASGELSEVGFFDVYPENDNASFEGGTWSNYPYYRQNMVAVSSMDRGLFVLRPRG
jgi:choice-of-anchor B domain-containing protein